MTTKPTTTGLTCRDVIAMLMDYLEKTLTQGTVDMLERHVATCPSCVAYINTYKRTRELTGRSERVEMPDDMKRRLRELVLQHLPRSRPDPAS